MKVVHIESGLGNQMLSYCEYLALKKIHPEEDIYIENIVYDIPEVNEYICQWNGYELKQIFGIDAPNIKDFFGPEKWQGVMRDVKRSEFWKRNWNYPVYITNALNEQGLQLKNIRGDFERDNINNIIIGGKKTLLYRIKQSGIYVNCKRRLNKLLRRDITRIDKEQLFYGGTDDVFTGQRLSFRYLGNDIECIEQDIRSIFTFPEFTEERNKMLAEYLQRVSSVAIHARRGDMLSINGKYYKSGYFRRAIKYIKKHVEAPVFFFFCDPGSVEWCKKNEKIFGLNFSKDKVYFVDWNKGESSYRDMQLMSLCKHNVITNSSFGWWGAYLNQNPNKITISPEEAYNTTHHF